MPTRTWPCRSRPISSSVGRWTLRTMSQSQTAPSSAIVAPASANAWSATAAPAPAPASTTGSRPRPLYRLTVSGDAAARRSSSRRSLGMPIFMIFCISP